MKAIQFLSELTTDLLTRYKKAAYADAKKADSEGDYERGNKRFKGINKATNKQFDNDLKKHNQQGVAEGAPIVVMPSPERLKKAEPTKVRYQGDIVPPTKPPSTEKRGVKGRQGQRPMPKYDEGWEEIAEWLNEEGKASRALCQGGKPDSQLGASQLASCKSQGLRARDGDKSHLIGKGGSKVRVTVGGKKIKGKKYGGPLPDYGTRKGQQ
jgi:hypothetical protein